MEFDFAESIHGAIEDQVCAGALVQGMDGFVRVGDQHGRDPGDGVGAPGSVCRVDHRLGIATGHAVVVGGGVDRFGAAVTEIEGGGLLPLAHEPVHVDQFGGIIAVVDEEGEHTTCGDGLELRPVPHQQHLRSRLLGQSRDAVEGEGAREGGFIDDDQLTLPEGLAGALMGVPPFRSVLRPDAEVIREYLRCDRRRSETDDATPAVLTLPRGAECTHGRRLPGPSGADQHIDYSTRHGHRRKRRGLILTKHSPFTVGAGGHLLDDVDGHDQRGSCAGALEEPVFGGEEFF